MRCTLLLEADFLAVLCVASINVDEGLLDSTSLRIDFGLDFEAFGGWNFLVLLANRRDQYLHGFLVYLVNLPDL